MDNPKQQIVEKLKAANNILVTVSSNPSVDQLAACIGLTLLLNKLDKHATAVFSGQIPSTIEFLRPEETLEKDTNSLRDFIIALDKTKADKLRYKVEDKVVKIFITPYRTSLSADDLDFSQGDFNVDVVLALGVQNQTDLDDAITSHGRILHDATVMCINTRSGGELGSLNWIETSASSLSELASEIATSFDKPMLDEQISTALLTGIVAETDRFRNDKTTATTMSVSADLMKAGANQQLVAKELEHEVAVRNDSNSSNNQNANPDASKPSKRNNDDGTLDISHDEEHIPEEKPMELPAVDGNHTVEPVAEPKEEAHDSHRSLVTQPPTFGGELTANSRSEDAGLTNVNTFTSGNNENHDNQNTHGQSVDPIKEPEAPKVEPPKEEKPAKKPEPEFFAPPQRPMLEEEPAKPEPPKAPAPEPSKPQPSLWQPPTASTLTPEPAPTQSAPHPVTPPMPTPPVPAPQPQPPMPPQHHETLTELEESVEHAHVDTAEDLQKARDEVMRALNEQPTGTLPPVEALNAHPVDLGNHAPTPPDAPSHEKMIQPLPPNEVEQPPLSASPADRPLDMPLPPSISVPPPQTQPPTNAPNVGLNAPPPVPPPMVPPHFGG